MSAANNIETAYRYYNAGDLSNAEATCKKILKIHPNDLDVIMLLSDIAYRRQDYETAVGLLRKAINIMPDSGELYCNIGLLFQAQGKLEDAIFSFQKAIQMNPSLPQAYYNLGIALKEKWEFNESIISYKKAINLDPFFTDAYYNLGMILKEEKQLDEAIHYFQKAVNLNPGRSDIYGNLGLAFKEKGHVRAASESFMKVLQIDPDNIIGVLGLAAVLQENRNFDKAEEYYRKALLLDPENAGIYFNLGLLYIEKWELDSSIECFQKAVQFRKNDPNVYYRLGAAYFLKGKLDLAAENYNRALSLKDDFTEVHQGFMMLMSYTRDFGPEEVLSAHQRFAEKFEQPLLSHIFPHSKKGVNGKRLRIGYVSPDFRRHSVAYFIEPVLTEHNREDFEVFCYSNLRTPDHATRRIRSSVEHWRDIYELSDEETVEVIRKDGIDILVDLAGHTGGNRILLFACRPAPVQVSWIGYPATTGLESMDYKIVDGYTDPPGMTERWYTEKLFRLPESFLCYLPEGESPDVAPLPALTRGYITFGSFNNFAKLSRDSIKMWIRILKEAPNSRIILKSHCFSDEGTRRYAVEMFAREGVGEERVELLLYDPSLQDHLSLYGRFDIALDTFPYNGTTTTCEALWMGVPVITLAGNTHASRVGVSLLRNVGLGDLVAATPEEYVRTAVELASDIKNLHTLRNSLRNIMRHSPLTDAKRFTANLERCYQQIWEDWCKGVKS